MRRSIHRPNVQYAVIQASSNKNCPERLVIAYPDESCLRALIAAPSIIGLGFASRAQAIAKINDGMHLASLPKQKLVTAARFHAAQAQEGICGKNRIVHRVVQYVLSTAIVLFYSKNLLSTTIRMALRACS
jgi:hypothetical protein